MPQLNGTGLKRLHRDWRRRRTARLALLLEAVDSPFNVGSIVRTAAAMSADALYLVRVGAAPNSAKVQKAAMGTQRYLTWQDFETVADAVAAARADGYRVVGLELADEAEPLFDVDTSGDTCIAVGHEDRGLTPAALAACDVVAYIPQLGRVGSLGVAAAAAVGAYEVRRQQFAAAGRAEPAAEVPAAVDRAAVAPEAVAPEAVDRAAEGPAAEDPAEDPAEGPVE